MRLWIYLKCPNYIWQFRIVPRGTANTGTAPTLELVNIHAETAVRILTAALPVGADPKAITQGSWYHVAVAYNGSEAAADNVKFYWTLLDPSRTAANALFSGQMTDDLIIESPDQVIGSEGRAVGGGSGNFVGVIDEVRISSIARSASGFLFAAAGDSDADGMADAWETTYLGGLGESPSGDYDHDGTSNLTEYRLGLIPNSGSSLFLASRTANGLISWPGAVGVTFDVLRSTSLAAGSWTLVSPVDGIAGAAGTTSFTDPSPPLGSAFYRVALRP